MIAYEYKTLLDNEQKTYLKKIREFNIKDTLATPQEVNDFFRTNYRIQENAEEYIYIAAVNSDMRPLGIFEISHGSANRSSFIIRDIFVKLFLCGAIGFFLIHNHPSQNAQPSEMDRFYTNQLERAAKLMGIRFVDHIIIGDDYFSFREEEKLKEKKVFCS